jgi:hypothetical protein
MKRQIAILSLLLAAMVAPDALAQSCPTPPSGPQCIGGSLCWYTYTPDDSCPTVSGSNGWSGDYMCYSRPSVHSAVGWASINYEFTVDSSANFGNWSAETSIDFSDPNSSTANAVEIWAGVTHNGQTTYTLLDSWDGADGSASCETIWGTFSAQDNDHVSITVYLYRLHSNAAVEASYPRIFSTNY